MATPLVVVMFCTIARQVVMGRYHRFSFWVLGIFLLNACSAQVTNEYGMLDNEASPVYTQRAPSRDGIGKIYMGREIAGVMSPQRSSWLDRPSREIEEFPDQVIRNMNLKSGDVVADIGAGTGYFSFRLSPIVPEGKVLAVDIQPEMLAIIEKRKQKARAKNIIPILGSITNPNLPEGSVDVVLMVDAYHEFSYPREMMENIVRALRPGGRLFLIEYKGEDASVAKSPLHKMTAAQARKEMKAVGLNWRGSKSFLPEQHFMIFEKP